MFRLFYCLLQVTSVLSLNRSVHSLVDTNSFHKTVSITISTLVDNALDDCDLGMFISRPRFQPLASEILADLNYKSILLLDDLQAANDSLMIHKNYYSRFKQDQDLSKDYWCFAWIVLANTKEEAAIFLQQIRVQLRKYWTRKSYNKYLVYLDVPARPDEILNDDLLNSLYGSNTIYLMKDYASPDQVVTHEYRPFGPEPNNKPHILTRRFSRDTMYLIKHYTGSIFPDIFYDMHGYAIRYISLDSGGIFNLEQSHDYKILLALSKYMNFKFNVHNAPDGKYGALLPDGSWNGFIGGVTRGEADMTIDASITLQRWFDVDYGPVVYWGGFTFAVSSPKELPQWQNIFRPFDDIETWLVIAASTVLIGLTFYILNIGEKMSADKRINHLLELGDNLFLSFRLLMQNTSTKVFGYMSLNAFFTLTCFFTFLLASMYKLSLVSHLTKPSYSSVINSLEELADSDYGWAIVGKGQADYTFFATSDIPLYKRIFERMQFCASGLECLQRSESSKFAYISWQFYQLGLISENFVDVNGVPSLVQAKEMFNNLVLQSSVFQPGTPMMPAVNRIFMRITQAGLVWTKWKGDQLLDIVADGKRKAQSKAKKATQEAINVNEQAFTLGHLQAAFYILGGGLTVSLIVFAAELIMKRKEKENLKEVKIKVDS